MKMKYKRGDMITDLQKDDPCWSVWKIIHVYNDDSLGNFYWIKCLHYHSVDGSIASYMDIHSEDYMNLLNIRKVTKKEYPKIVSMML